VLKLTNSNTIKGKEVQHHAVIFGALTAFNTVKGHAGYNSSSLEGFLHVGFVVATPLIAMADTREDC
jgi:hypothetical protein